MIRCAGCRTASTSANGSRASSRSCGAASLRRRCSALDHFKDVNDTLGHHVGDALILNVTQRLSRVVRGHNLVARLGGDEFAIITSCPSDSYSLQAIAGRIISAVCAPYSINGNNIIIGASIGIAVIDRRAGDAADILRYADMALYRAKNEGRNRACIYDAAMDADLTSASSWKPICCRRSAATASPRPISRSSMPAARSWSASRRWPAGTIRPPARSRRWISFRSPSTPASSSSSASGCCGAPASMARAGRT
jgi:diguanylate cyclase (GGDEF)-like protein